MKKMFLFIFIALFLTACGAKENIDTGTSEPLPPAKAEATQGDFIYKLSSEKDVYDEFGDIAVFAEITYIGEMDSIDIYHSASPFSFPFEERTRGFTVDYAMNEPLIVTTLERGITFRQNYEFAGGYSDTDDEVYVDFVETVINEGFPEGEYIIHGIADFWTEDPAEAADNQKVYLKADIGFNVVKPGNR
ncbi:membrane lipoprotein lipid attachment site-containing protein [Sporosarcina siberiensis]|uniref:Membrane lipoprotein lipid attachment site-containing protein n=1 Tax=Sporosarcina siberiensis TaxID=1365606 RepID=A0ABW4SCW5_9BACL